MLKPATPNETALLTTVSTSEGVQNIGTMQGYDVIVGSTVENPDLFTDFSDHPRKLVWIPRLKEYSSAAGRYQTLEGIFDAYKKQLDLPDFSPASQDAIALQLMEERGARAMINAGNLQGAIAACANCWASLPGSTDGQGTNSFMFIQSVFLAAGGTIA